MNTNITAMALAALFSFTATARLSALAPISLNGLTLTLDVTGGNGVQYVPGGGIILLTSGSKSLVYTSNSYTIVATSGSGLGAVEPYLYSVSGNVGTVMGTTTISGAPTQNYALTFTTGLSGTFTGTWGSSTDFGTFTLAPSSNQNPLVNISCRLELAAGTACNAGFVVGGSIPSTVLIRADGPTLSSFGVTDAIPTTTISIYSGDTVIASNTNWSSGSAANTSALESAFASTGAFPLPMGSADSAILVTLPPGPYSAVARATGATDKGSILIEAYYVAP
jgi:hypothetical protein